MPIFLKKDHYYGDIKKITKIIFSNQYCIYLYLQEGLIKRKNNEDNLEYSERPNKLQMSLKGLLETV
ncbi:hypothetical protein Glove_169g32 [Diversispora epigaea]|uniref:Uncharacterized protein n=1 Tax=Diversispora epigaea TaxID=1348612 RepID=A0A397IU70_9GLOM|nr:hypothetical protein Glove_169g32 [Diversispora epigaea]